METIVALLIPLSPSFRFGLVALGSEANHVLLQKQAKMQ
jgi:hypothetical protein